MMSKLSTCCFLAVVSLTGAAWSYAEGGNSDAEKAVAAMEDLWAQSQRTNNPDLIAPHLSDKIVATGTDGSVTDKAGMLAAAKKAKYVSVEYPDMKVTVFGDTAIATGGFKGEGTNSEGKPFVPERWTDTWVKMPDGSWQCVATHSSTVITK